MSVRVCMRSLLVPVLAVLALAGCQQVAEKTLGNGLRVVVERDTRAPVVVSQLWYRVGSVDEPARWTGISHALEHMMFKGTPRYPAGVFARLIARRGGDENAFTAQDETVFYEEIARNQLPLVFRLEADRMQHLAIRKRDFRKEIQVVMEERRMRTDDSPDAIVYERFARTAWRVHPYGVPVIGWMHNIRKLTAEDVRTWYHRWYAPNNAVLVVVGDVRPRQVFALAKHYFGPIPRRAIPLRHIPAEPPQRHPRHVVVRIPAQVPYLLMGWHVPVITRGRGLQSDTPYALDVLAGVLSGGASSRLPTDLVRHQQIAATVSAGYQDMARYPELFTISAVPAQGHSVGQVQTAIETEIHRLQRHLISTAELRRIRIGVVAADVFQRDSMSGQAMMLGTLALLHLPETLVTGYVRRLEAVTPAEVQAVARRYLRRDNRTVAELQPLPMALNIPHGPPQEHSHVH
ncbi:MAG TPA: pitrilysin family protein [Acidiferrobacteraceae bacterium]|nr:pitrilysin family protein [Acidiferrobacteraceae bacterium]